MNPLSLMSLTLLFPYALAAESKEILKPPKTIRRKKAPTEEDIIGMGPDFYDIFVVRSYLIEIIVLFSWRSISFVKGK